jgi:hypothetical protein
MSLFDDPPRHDFPDRAIRRLLEDPHNLRDLLAAVLPDMVDRFDFDHVQAVGREFVLDDWRRRESDLLFRLPWRAASGLEGVPPALVCVLIEHQSAPDPRMPLRILLYAVLYWEQEWRAWEAEHARGEPLRLSPVVPVVFHTGGEPWRTHRTLAALIGGPEELERFAPRWEPLFWDLAERSPEDLIAAAGELLAALAVVRAEREAAASFREVFGRVLQRLEGVSERERMRWHDLLWFLLSWGLRRRPQEERAGLLEAAESSQTDMARREEVRKMSETVQQTWEQELLALGKAEGERITTREDLQLVLEEKFGALPPILIQQIEAISDLQRLRSALRRAIHIQSLGEFEL